MKKESGQKPHTDADRLAVTFERFVAAGLIDRWYVGPTAWDTKVELSAGAARLEHAGRHWELAILFLVLLDPVDPAVVREALGDAAADLEDVRDWQRDDLRSW